MGRVILVNTTNLSIVDQAKLEDYLTDVIKTEYKEGNFYGQFHNIEAN